MWQGMRKASGFREKELNSAKCLGQYAKALTTIQKKK